MTPAPSRRRRRAWLAARCGLYAGVIWVGLVAIMKAQENLLVYPGAGAGTPWAGDPPPGAEDVTFPAADGTAVHGWFLPARGAGRGAVLFSHGNGANVSYYGPLLEDLRTHLGRSVLVYDYPGYGRSAGSPTEAGCYAAGDAAYRYLTEARGVPPGRVVLMGESLGGAVSVDLAARHDHAALVLLATFTSLPAAASGHYPWLPCRTLMANRFDSLSKLPRCRRPVFVAHGAADTIVPIAHGERLYEAAPGPKRFVRVEGAGHALPFDDAFYDQLRPFLDDLR